MKLMVSCRLDGEVLARLGREWEVASPERAAGQWALEGEALVAALRDADALVTEATYSDVEPDLARQNGHLTAGQAARLARAANVKQLILSHISGRHREKDLEEEARAIHPNTVIARDFDTYKINKTP